MYQYWGGEQEDRDLDYQDGYCSKMKRGKRQKKV
jgi:hypothetical protein